MFRIIRKKSPMWPQCFNLQVKFWGLGSKINFRYTKCFSFDILLCKERRQNREYFYALLKPTNQRHLWLHTCFSLSFSISVAAFHRLTNGNRQKLLLLFNISILKVNILQLSHLKVLLGNLAALTVWRVLSLLIFNTFSDRIYQNLK